MPTEKFYGANNVMTATKSALGSLSGLSLVPGIEGEIPSELLDFFAQLSLLEQVPFNNLVPDEELLPLESIRFFYLDKAWIDALIQGVLSVSTTNAVERAQLEKLYPQVRTRIDEHISAIRHPSDRTKGAAKQLSGFLLRSRVVSGWPNMHVRAYSTEVGENDESMIDDSSTTNRRKVIRVLRMQRLAPSVMIVIFDGVPKLIHVEEPRQGLQFGVNLKAESNGTSAWVPARSADNAEYVNENSLSGNPDDNPETSEEAAKVPIWFREDSGGVLDVAATAQEFADKPFTALGGSADGAEFALEMIRFPYRQVFGEAGDDNDGLSPFRPTIVGTSEKNTALFKRVTRRR